MKPSLLKLYMYEKEASFLTIHRKFYPLNPCSLNLFSSTVLNSNSFGWAYLLVFLFKLYCFYVYYSVLSDHVVNLAISW